jgi:hypothetical protein
MTVSFFVMMILVLVSLGIFRKSHINTFLGTNESKTLTRIESISSVFLSFIINKGNFLTKTSKRLEVSMRRHLRVTQFYL